MKIESYPALIGLWAEHEMGPSQSARPKGISRRGPVHGRTLADLGHEIVEGREGYREMRPNLQERYVYMKEEGWTHKPAELNAWEAAFDADLKRVPIVLEGPQPTEGGVEIVERIGTQVEALIGGRRAA